MIKQRSILPALCALSLLANGTVALGQTAGGVGAEARPPMPGASAGQAIPQNGDSAQTDSSSSKGESNRSASSDASSAAETKGQTGTSNAGASSSDDSSPSGKKAGAGTAKGPNAAKSTNSKASKAVSKPKGSYVTEEPKSDTSGSPTRVHRPGSDPNSPPIAPAIGNSNPNSPMPLLPPPPAVPPRERFPSVGQLEQLMFGHTTPNLVVDNRLDKLESAIFQKTSPDLDIEQRIKRLKDVIVGDDGNARPPANSYSDPARAGAYGDQSHTAFASPSTTFPSTRGLGMTLPELDHEPTPVAPFFPNYGHYDLNQQLSIPDAEKFALDVMNEVRQQQGLGELYWDTQAYKVASEQVEDLVKRDAVSHQNSKGENPDLRYTKAGGSDSLVEGAIMFPSAEKLRPTRQLVVKMLETLNTRQDDKDALLYPHASGFSMAFKWSPDKKKLVCCTEVVTKHGQMETLPSEALVGDKIEIKGSVAPPYKFQKITVAWEGLSNSPPDDSAESSEALPYFPPLDYEAHATKSNKDYDKGVKFLQIAGITAAIAGGLFIPPVALAAPLIAASMGTPTPKAVSEIPVKGGVKTDGSNFARSLTLSNQGKEGIYYVTVWATPSMGEESVAVSRRAIVARKEHLNTSVNEKEEQHSDEEKKDGDGKQAEPGAL